MRKTIRWSNEKIDKFLLENKRTIIRNEDYSHCQKKIMWKCLKDGYIWSCTPTHILNDNIGCPKCAGNAKLTNEDVDKKLIGRNIKRIENYIGNDTNIKWKCVICDCEWKQNPDHILNSGSGCPECLNKKEKFIKSILTDHNICFEFHKCLKFNKRRYFVDFVINDKYIEYNGKQHYEPVPFYGGIKAFEKQQLRDEQLRTHCNDNSIKLLEIPYWLSDKEIEVIIKDFINSI